MCMCMCMCVCVCVCMTYLETLLFAGKIKTSPESSDSEAGGKAEI